MDTMSRFISRSEQTFIYAKVCFGAIPPMSSFLALIWSLILLYNIIWYLESVILNVFTTPRNVTSIAGIRIQPCSKQETLDFTHRSYIIVSHYNILLCNTTTPVWGLLMTSVPPQKSGPSTSRTLRGPDPTLEHFGLANISPL